MKIHFISISSRYRQHFFLILLTMGNKIFFTLIFIVIFVAFSKAKPPPPKNGNGNGNPLTSVVSRV